MTILLRSSICAALAVPVIAGRAFAQQPVDPLPIARTNEPMRLDGRLDEPVWTRATALSMVRLRPTAGGAPSAPSIVMLTYDDAYLYAAARFDGVEPADTRSGSLTRDRLVSDNEFRLLLDTFNDSENGVEFVVNPAGTRVDRAVLNDGREINLSWDAFWDAATSVHEGGWTAEMRIPFSSLRFQSVNGRVVMGVIASRYRAVNNELSTHPELPGGDASPHYRPLLGRRIVFEGIESHAPVYFTPYFLAGRQRANVPRTDVAGFRADIQRQLESGIDAKLSLASNLTLDLTVNTDFAQVEADDQQVNLSRFSLFFPEKRPFFQERSAIFQFNTISLGSDRLFHSRRIGIAADGTPLRIYGGARVVGRAGDWDVGALSMQAEASGESGTENLAVVRLRRAAFNEGSWVGGMFTSRVAGHSNNFVAATDAQIRLAASDYLTLQYAQTLDSERSEQGLDAGMVMARVQRNSSSGLMYVLLAKWQGPEFEPGLGFVTRRDHSTFNGNLRYGWQPRSGILQQYQPSLNVTHAYNNRERRLELGSYNLIHNISFKNGIGGAASSSVQIEALPADLQLGDGVFVPAGRHTATSVSAGFSGSNGWRFRPFISGSAGEFYDGHRTALGLGPRLTVNQHLELGGDYNIERLRFPSRNQKLNADIARVRVNAALDTRLSGAAFLQYNRVARLWTFNGRLRYHAGEGRDFWLVVNEQVNTDLERDPASPLPRSRSNAVALKYSHTMAR